MPHWLILFLNELSRSYTFIFVYVLSRHVSGFCALLQILIQTIQFNLRVAVMKFSVI